MFLTTVMHIIGVNDFPLFCSNSAGRMLASKIAYSVQTSAAAEFIQAYLVQYRISYDGF